MHTLFLFMASSFSAFYLSRYIYDNCSRRSSSGLKQIRKRAQLILQVRIFCCQPDLLIVGSMVREKFHFERCPAQLERMQKRKSMCYRDMPASDLTRPQHIVNICKPGIGTYMPPSFGVPRNSRQTHTYRIAISSLERQVRLGQPAHWNQSLQGRSLRT